MSWRDQIAANSAGHQALRGSFRGAEFIVPTDELEFGRRTQVHEFPLRDEPYVEDLGRKARRFQIEVFVTGDNYLAQRDALIVAIEESGPGLLTHPYYGVLNVTVVEARVRQSSREGGRATFTLTCIEAGENIFLPLIEADTASRVETQAKVATESTLQEFARKFSVEGLTGINLAAIEAEVSRTISGITQAVGDIANTVAAQIRAPYNMAGLIVGGVQQIATLAATPFEALRLYKGLFSAGSGAAAIPHTTAQRRQQAQATSALHEMTRTAAVIEAARVAAVAEFDASNEALALRDDLLAALDARMNATDPVTGEPIGNDLFDALRALRAALVEDTRLRAGKLPQITTYTPKAMIPARVLAWQIYGDAARAEEIVARNNIRHPLFVPGGVQLEVLTDA
jgi:prophage DNA circulation protein